MIFLSLKTSNMVVPDATSRINTNPLMPGGYG